MNGGGRRKAFPLGSWCLMSTAFGWWPGLQSPAGYAERCPRSCVKASHGICSKYICIYMKASRDPWLYTWTSGPLLKARAEGVGEALLGLTGKLERNWLWEGSTSVKLVWKLSLAAHAVLTWTQALHLSVDLVPLPAEGILTHNHPIWLLQANTLQVCGLLWSLSCCGWS